MIGLIDDFKEGDLVRVLQNTVKGHEIGTICMVERDEFWGYGYTLLAYDPKYKKSMTYLNSTGFLKKIGRVIKFKDNEKV